MTAITPIVGSSSGCGLGVLKDIFLYLKHKRQRVKRIKDDFDKLQGKVDCLKAKWEDLDEDIDRNPQLEVKNLYAAVKIVVVGILQQFKEIQRQYEATKQKIWIFHFFKLASLDKDIENLTTQIDTMEYVPQLDRFTRLGKVKIVVQTPKVGQITGGILINEANSTAISTAADSDDEAEETTNMGTGSHPRYGSIGETSRTGGEN